MRPNWFVAFPVDGAFAEALPPPPRGFRCFPAEDLHMTLAFLGGCGEAAAMRALGALDAVRSARPLAAFDVGLGEVAAMGGRPYTALSALLDGGRETAAGAIATLRGPLCEAAGVRPDPRPPKPHVTLTRPRRRADGAERAAGLAWAAALDLRAIRRHVDRLALYTWSDERPRRLFSIVAERRLA